jgi:hypothetical protein
MKSEEYYTEADWRCHTVVRVAATTTVPGLGTLPVGAVGKAVGIVDYKASRITFSIPDATALFLNLSKRHHEDAAAVSHKIPVSPTPQDLEDDDAFAYLENIMASVVFAYTALESFANEEIPDDFIHTIEKGRCKELYDKAQIEKYLSLEVKLGDILPVVCGVTSPKGSKSWEDYVALETLRHSIIHMKKSDREHIGYSSKSVWSRVIKEPLPQTFAVAKAIIAYFYKSRSLKPHWYENLPF